MQDEIEKIKAQAAELLAKADKMEKLKQLFPDIKVHTNRWGTKRNYSKQVNSVATNVEIRHNCGCCADSPVEAWPYLNTEFGPIYSDPPSFFVGEQNGYGYGQIESSGWEKTLRASNISESVINQVRAFFDANKPGEFENEE
jgi:hypothetical protein